MSHDPSHSRGHDGEPWLDRLWRRQEARADLALAFWDILGARPGWRLADVGCGPGGFALRYAALTGPTGHVHAVDADPGALAYLRGRLDPRLQTNVTTEELDITRAPLPDLAFHAILCTAMLHHVDDLGAALRQLRASNAPLLIAEFDPEGPGDVGPPRAERIAPATLAQALRAAGFEPGPARALSHEMYAILSLPASA